MTAETDLLPLPELSYLGDDADYGYDGSDMRDYARANLAELQREVEGLRAEVAELRAKASEHRDGRLAALERTERLAGALREAMQALVPLHNAHMPDERAGLTDDDVSAAEAAFELARAALDQETTNG